MRQEKKIPVITLLLLALNVAVYLYTEWMGSSSDTAFMLDMGASYEPYIIEEHEYYRLITHFFLHYGWDHLFNNMVSLLILGYSLENVLGRLRYTVVYFLSGVLAGICSVACTYYITPENAAVSCGASGAVYGLMGALLVLLITSRPGERSSTVPRYILFIGLSLYSGMQDQSIDNAAHIGGFVSGFLICLIIGRKKHREVRYES